jgi:hypothetical protein
MNTGTVVPVVMDAVIKFEIWARKNGRSATLSHLLIATANQIIAGQSLLMRTAVASRQA